MMLAVLAARRVLSPALWGLALVLFVWAGRPAEVGALASPPGIAAPFEPGDERLALAWSALAAVALLLIAHRAARLTSRWRSHESDWLAPRPLSRVRLVSLSLLGISVGIGAWLGAAAVASLLAETRPAGGRPTSLGQIAVEPLLLLPGESGERLIAGEGIDFLRLGFDAIPARGSGPVAYVTARIARGSQLGPPSRVAAFGHTLLDVAVPAGSGAVEPLRLEVQVEGAPLTLRAESVLAVSTRSPETLSVRLALHAWMVAVLVAATALAVGTRLPPALATTFLAALGLASLELGGPLSELVRALGEAGEGLAPALPSTASALTVLVGTGAGALAAARGLAPWRAA